MAACDNPAYRRALRVVKSLRGLVEDLQQQHCFIADPQALSDASRAIMDILDAPVCKAKVKRDGVWCKCNYQAKRGGYCGKHNKAWQAEMQSDIRKQQEERALGDTGPAHTDHAFAEFVPTCPGCLFKLETRSSSASTSEPFL